MIYRIVVVENSATIFICQVQVFAFVLALAMILTTYQPTTTYAATKAPTISAKKMTLQVGSKKTLTVKNAGKNATLKRIKDTFSNPNY